MFGYPPLALRPASSYLQDKTKTKNSALVSKSHLRSTKGLGAKYSVSVAKFCDFSVLQLRHRVIC